MLSLSISTRIDFGLFRFIPPIISITNEFGSELGMHLATIPLPEAISNTNRGVDSSFQKTIKYSSFAEEKVRKANDSPPSRDRYKKHKLAVSH